MPHEASELKFLATPEEGEVSALLVRPEYVTHLLVLGHGASTNMRHATLQAIAERLGHPIEPDPTFTLRPKHGVKVALRRRG